MVGDNINHPEHYTNDGIECIDAISAARIAEEFRGFCKGNVLMNIRTRLLHVYAHLIFRALESGIGEEFEWLGIDSSKYYNNRMVWQIICTHLAFYELDLIG